MKFWNRKKRPDHSEESADARKQGIKGKKPGWMKRIWSWLRTIDWKDPLNRWKLIFVLFAAFVLIGIISYSAIEITSTPTFCSSCHEMAPEYVTYKASSHNQIKCTQCHIPPGIDNLLTHKVKALKEVYLHVIGQQPNPIHASEPIDNVVCLQCHSKNRLVTASGDLIPAHKKHIDKEIPCVRCHQGVAHGKIVERGINTADTYDFWTEENVHKLYSKAYINPNMGTCIDCHDQVNQGKEPWKEEHADQAKHETAEVTGEELTVKTTNLILKALGKQTYNAKVSMECATCHLDINTPLNHKRVNWDQQHGGDALKELNKCTDCHQESKWIKSSPKQDIQVLLAQTEHNNQTAAITMEQVQGRARTSSFCSTCHKERPSGHLESDLWLTQHADYAKAPAERQECFVCHDYGKPEPTVKITASTDVYCKFCHRTGIKAEELQNKVKKK